MMAIIRTGITRTVFLVGGWAVKVPTLRGGVNQGRLVWFCRGILANDSEQQWSGVRGLNPVVWSLGSLVNVYRRADPVGDFDDYEALTPDWCPAGDEKPDNIGIVNGQVVWIDYDMSWNGPKPECLMCHLEAEASRP